MEQRKAMYIMVAIDQNEDGLSFQSWWSPDAPQRWEQYSYQYRYVYLGDACDWWIFASGELTPVLQHTVGSTADKQCLKAREINKNRKLANR